MAVSSHFMGISQSQDSGATGLDVITAGEPVSGYCLSRVYFCSLPTSDGLSWVPPKTVSSRLPLCCLSPRSQSLGLRTRTDISLPSVLPRPRDRRDYDALLIQMMWHTYFKFTPVGQRFGRCVDRFAGVYAANSVNSTPEYNSPFRARQGECGGQISLCDHSRYA